MELAARLLEAFGGLGLNLSWHEVIIARGGKPVCLFSP